MNPTKSPSPSQISRIPLSGIRRRPIVAAFAILVMVLASSVPGEASVPVDVNPQSYFNSVMANPNFEQEPGEGWAWHVNSRMGNFLTAYQAGGGTAWLDYGVQYYDWAISHMREGPDGYLGWIGPHIQYVTASGERYRQDQHIGDAILTRHLLAFAEEVYNDPDLHEDYLEKAESYVELTKVHLMEKWDARGTYHRFGGLGAYEFWDHYTPEDLSVWIQDQTILHESSVTQQFNKQTAMGLNSLRLWRITGEETYRQRAIEIFGYLKSRMQHYDGTYIWNFREPALRADVPSVNSNLIKTWIAPHPNNSGYMSTEVSQIVEAYHSGIVFDQQDIERIIKTNMEIMWNGSTSNPEFGANNSHTLPDSTAEGRRWSSLEDFSQQSRDLRGSGGSTDHSKISHAYYENVTNARPPSFERRLLNGQSPEDIHVLDWPHGETRSLNLAFVTDPVFFPIEEDTIIGVRSIRSVSLEIAVYDAAGEVRHFAITPTHNRNGNYTTLWNGTNPANNQPLDPGNYRIRFDAGEEGYRDYPITITSGPAPPAPTITMHPVSMSAQSGGTAYFSVGVSGEQISYQWRHNGVPVEGANQSVLVLNGVTYEQAGQYRVEVSNPGGSILSNTATLSLPSFTLQVQVSPAGGGSIQQSREGSYWQQEPAQLTAVPGAGYQFVEWTGDATGSDNPISVVMDADKTVTAHFESTGTTSIFANSTSTLDLENGWKWNYLGYFYDLNFPVVYSYGIEDWLYIVGESESDYYFWAYQGGYWGWAGSAMYPFYHILSGSDAGAWHEVSH